MMNYMLEHFWLFFRKFSFEIQLSHGGGACIKPDYIRTCAVMDPIVILYNACR